MAVVSISRQVGSHGEEIAALTAEMLSYTLINGNEIHQLAQECDLEFKKECELYEREMTYGFRERFFLNKPANASLYAAINYELAARNNVVVFGRGSQVAYQQIPWILKVRVVAPRKVRVERLSRKKDIPLEEAEKFVEHYDKERKGLVEQLFQLKVSDWSLYDIVINTVFITYESAAEMIQHAVRKMGPMPDETAWKERLLNLSRAKYAECAIRKRVRATSYSFINVSAPSSDQVIITGSVPDNDSKYMAEKIAYSFEGVERVENQLIVAGSSL